MAEHKAAIRWERSTDDFEYDTYNREHTWAFEGGVSVPASAAPEFLGKPEHVDPEEAFVASLSACHMLTFLAIAARKHYSVDTYADDATGYLEKDKRGKLVMTRVILRPEIAFSGERIPTPEQIERMHDQSHDQCFIANSVKTDVRVECS